MKSPCLAFYRLGAIEIRDKMQSGLDLDNALQEWLLQRGQWVLCEEYAKPIMPTQRQQAILRKAVIFGVGEPARNGSAQSVTDMIRDAHAPIA
ncbi:MAG: hypothetical protein ACRBCK_05595 [Alphaproteobacteria bacterium]